MTTLAAIRSLRFPDPREQLHIGLFLIGLLWLLPFLFPYKAPPVPSFRAESLATILGLGALLVVPGWAARLPLPRIACLPVGFVALILLQAGLGRLAFYQQGVLGVLYLAWASGLMVLAALLRRELGLERVARLLAGFLLAGLIGCDLIGLAQHLDSYAFLGRYIIVASASRVWGNLTQANHLADYLALGLASMFYLWATGRLRGLYALALGALSIYILALTGSRASWLYFAGLVVLAGGFFAGERSGVNRRLLIASLAGLIGLYVLPALVAAVQPAALPVPVSSAERLAETGAYEQRPAILCAGWRMFRDAPVLGVGFRQFGIHTFLLNPDLPAPRVVGFTDNAHNLALHVMAEFGVIGLIVLLAGAVPWMLGLLRQPRTPAFWWLLALAMVLAVHSMLEYPLWYAYFLGVAAVLLGLAERRTLELHLADGRLRRLRLTLWATLLLGALVWGQVIRDYLVLENFLAFRYRYVHASEELNRQARNTLLELHSTSLLFPWVELGLARTIHVSTDRLADKLAVNSRAMRAFPIDDVVYRQAMLLALAGEEGAATEQWRRAVTSFPELRNISLQILRRRVEDGLGELAPLLAYAENLN